MANSLLEALNLISMTGLDRPSYIEDPEEALLENREEVLQSLIDISGTIGPIPYHETDEFRQEAFDIAEGLAFPGAGIGASIRGGKAVVKGAFKSYWDDLLYGKNVASAKGVSPKFDPIDRKLGISGSKKKFEYWQKQMNRDSKRFSPEEMDWKYGKAYKDWKVKRDAFLKAMDDILGKEAIKMESEGKLMKAGDDFLSKILKRNKQSVSNIELEKAREELQRVLSKYDILDPDIYQAILSPKGKAVYSRGVEFSPTGELPDIITQALRLSQN